MKYFQLSFPLPISLLEYNVGEKYVAYYIENQIIQDSHEENVVYDQGQPEAALRASASGLLQQLDKFSIPIVKIYQLGHSLPLFAKEFFNQRIIKIREEKTQSFPKSSCTYTIENLEGIKVHIQTYCIDGHQDIDTPFTIKEPLSENQREKIDILTLNDNFVTKPEIERIKNHFRINDEKRWLSEKTSGITVYNLISIEVNYPKVQDEFENILKDVIKSFLIYQRKLLLVHYDKWMNFGNQTLEKLEKEVKLKSPTKTKLKNFFTDYISTYSDMAAKLNIQGAIETYNAKKISRGKSPLERQSIGGSDNIKAQKKSRILKKTGLLYKRGDGPINFNWNPRYFILDGTTLFYYTDASDKVCRGMTKLIEATVSPVDRFEDREYTFTITVSSPPRTFHLSGETREETEDWRDLIFEATKSKVPLSFSSPNMRPSADVEEERVKRSAGGYNGVDRIDRGSPPIMRKNSPLERSPSIDAGVALKKNVSRSLFKAKSRVLNELNIKEVPESLKDLEGEIKDLSSVDLQRWKIRNFKNGVKLFERGDTKNKSIKFGMKNWGVFGIILILVLLQSTDTAVKVALFGLVLGLYFLYQLHTLNRSNQTEIIGRVIAEEDALKIFQKVKKLKVRARWDLNSRNIKKLDTSRDKFSKNYEAELILPKVSWPYLEGLSSIKCDVDRWNFILNEDTFVMVEIFTLNDSLLKSRSNEFKMTEIFIAQRFSKMSGKCMVTLLNRISTNFVPTVQLSKFRRNRIQNLSVIRDFLSEEFFYDQVHEIESDEEDRKSDYAFDETAHHEAKQTIILPETPSANRRKSPSGHKETEKYHHVPSLGRMLDDEVIHEVHSAHSAHKITTGAGPKLVTKEGFDYKNARNFNEEISLVESLIRGTCNKRGRTLEERKPGYKITKSGGVECCNPDEIKSQEGIVTELLKTAGKTLMEGKNVVGVSLPVRIFEPRSSIERMADIWSFGPIYLNRAANTQDPVERMKNVISFCISGLYMLCKQMKPFNPIIGETYQGYWPDGSEINCEHTSHHPPITNFHVVDVNKKFTLSGYYELRGKLKGNSVVAHQYGPNDIKFKDGSMVTFCLPPFKLSGLLFGARIIEFQGDIVFTDKKNNLEAKLTFYENTSMFSKNLHPTDHFEGSITKLSDHSHEYSKFEGLWTSYIEFDGKRYWDLKVVDPIEHIDTNEPLESDCRYREDLIFLARKDLAKAQEHKIRLEKIQRADRKLRADYKEKENK